MFIFTFLGVIDADFVGELVLMIRNFGREKKIQKHDRIAQMLVIPNPSIELVEVQNIQIDATKRGEKGFGSTGKFKRWCFIIIIINIIIINFT